VHTSRRRKPRGADGPGRPRAFTSRSFLALALGPPRKTMRSSRQLKGVYSFDEKLRKLGVELLPVE
jgi:hypothetical protein